MVVEHRSEFKRTLSSTPLSLPDILAASSAMVNGLTLLTNNLLCGAPHNNFGVKMATAGGEVTVRKMTEYGTESGKPMAKPYVEVSLSKGVKGKALGVEGKLEGALTFSTLERPPSPKPRR